MNRNTANSGKINGIRSIAWQCLIICSLVEAFFFSARISDLYAGWNADFQKLVTTGTMVFAVIFLILLAVWAAAYCKMKPWKTQQYDIIGVGLMIIFHYFIRIGMVGTIQMDDGLVYYNFLNGITQHPEAFLTDFMSAGKLASHIAHGYVFLSMIGEFMMPGTTFGFQWVQLFMGLGAGFCLLGIFKKLFPQIKPAVLWFAAFVVSIQPMFLGLSTMCNLEYAITVFFIYVFYCYLNKKYILMVFWLLMLGTAKETGVMMAVGFAGALILAEVITRIRIYGVKNLIKKLNWKWYLLMAAFLAVVVVFASFAMNMEVWGGYTLKEVIRFGGEGNMTFTFNQKHFFMKLAQLYILNFGWIWAIILVIGLFVCAVDERVRNSNKIAFKPMFILIVCYFGYAFFLIFYQEAKQPRYNMLADVLFVMFAVLLLLKMFEKRKTILSTLTVLGLLMYGEAFVTIDPISAEVFTVVRTNSFPMLFTANFQSEMQEMKSNAGDFAYYNYQYTFIDRAINDILARYSWHGSSRILSAAEDVEVQFYYGDLKWDTKYNRRGYDTIDDPERFKYIRRDNVFEMLSGNDWPDSGVLIDTPWNKGDVDTAVARLSQFYEIDGPYVSKQGFAGSVIYYFILLKQ